MTKDTVPRVLNFDPDHEKIQSSVRGCPNAAGLLEDKPVCVSQRRSLCPDFFAVHQNGFLWQGARFVASQKA